MATNKKKELQREHALIKSQMTELDAAISTAEEAGEDAIELTKQFNDLQKKAMIKQAAIARAETIGDLVVKKSKSKRKDDDDDDDGDDDEDKDDNDDDDDDDDEDNVEKSFSAPTKKRVSINHGVALAPMKKAEYFGRLAVGQFYKKEMGLRKAQEVVMRTWGDVRVKDALMTNQPIIPQDFVNSVIPLLQAKATVRQFATVRAMPMGNLTLPRHNLGSMGAYMGEGSNIPVTRAGFDTINMSWKKYGALTYCTRELLEFTPVDAAAIITNDLISRLALLEDQNFLFGNGTSNGVPAPLGIMYQLNQNTNVINSSVNAQGNVDFQTVSYDLQALELALSGNLVPPPYVMVMSPHTESFLKQVSSTFGVYPFKEELAGGTLNGHKVFVTTLAPTNQPDTKATPTNTVAPILMVQPDELIIGDAYRYGMSMTDTASFVDGSTQINAFGQDLLAWKVTNAHDFAMMHDVSAAVLKADGWSIGNVGSKWSYDVPPTANSLAGSQASAAKPRSS